MCLVNRHDEDVPNRTLLHLPVKREHLITRGAKRDPRQEDRLSNMLIRQFFCIDDIFLKSSNHQPRAIAKSLVGLMFLSNIIGAVNPELQQICVGGYLFGVSVLRNLDG